MWIVRWKPPNKKKSWQDTRSVSHLVKFNSITLQWVQLVSIGVHIRWAFDFANVLEWVFCVSSFHRMYVTWRQCLPKELRGDSPLLKGCLGLENCSFFHLLFFLLCGHGFPPQWLEADPLLPLSSAWWGRYSDASWAAASFSRRHVEWASLWLGAARPEDGRHFCSESDVTTVHWRLVVLASTTQGGMRGKGGHHVGYCNID